MRLGAEVVDLIGLYLLNDADDVGRIGQIAIMQFEFYIFFMLINIQMIDPVGIKQ